MQNITRYSLQNLLVTRCKIRSLLVAEVDRCKKSFLTRSEKNLGTNVYLKLTKIDEFCLFILYFQSTKNRESRSFVYNKISIAKI